MENVFDTGEVIFNRITKSFVQQAAFQMYKLVGSHDLLGNPAAIFADVSGGVRQFYHEQKKGLIIKSPTAFAQSVVSLTGAPSASGKSARAKRPQGSDGASSARASPQRRRSPHRHGSDGRARRYSCPS